MNREVCIFLVPIYLFFTVSQLLFQRWLIASKLKDGVRHHTLKSLILVYTGSKVNHMAVLNFIYCPLPLFNVFFFFTWHTSSHLKWSHYFYPSRSNSNSLPLIKPSLITKSWKKESTFLHWKCQQNFSCSHAWNQKHCVNNSHFKVQTATTFKDALFSFVYICMSICFICMSAPIPWQLQRQLWVLQHCCWDPNSSSRGAEGFLNNEQILYPLNSYNF